MVTALACSLDGQQITVDLIPHTRLAALHPGSSTVVEYTTCNYGLADGFAGLAASFGLRVAGTESSGEVRAIERTDHPFFVGTLYQPQLRSTPDAPHPLFVGLLRAAAGAAS